MESDSQPTATNFDKCCRCGQEARFTVVVISVVDGGLLGSADFCWQDAIELAEGQPGLPVMIDPGSVATTRDECYRKRCDCLPAKLDRCERCTRLADVWVTAGTVEDIQDLDRGGLLCARCALPLLEYRTLPLRVRKELREVLDREGKEPCPF